VDRFTDMVGRLEGAKHQSVRLPCTLVCCEHQDRAMAELLGWDVLEDSVCGRGWRDSTASDGKASHGSPSYFGTMGTQQTVWSLSWNMLSGPSRTRGILYPTCSIPIKTFIHLILVVVSVLCGLIAGNDGNDDDE
jgi:hypothetical protein